MKPNTVNKARNSIEMPAQAFLRLATIVRAAKGGNFSVRVSHGTRARTAQRRHENQRMKTGWNGN